MYIPSHQALGNHPKLRRLARTLAISRPAAIGHLHYLWWWSQDYAPDGDLSYQRYTAEDIADAAMWEGDAYAFVDALKTSGFVDDVDGRLMLHDWEEYGGKIVKDLAKDRERKRGKGNPAASAGVPRTSNDVPNTSTGVPPEFHRNSGVEEIKREERREEKKRETPPTPSRGKAANAAAVPNAPYRLFARFCEETEADEASVPAGEKARQMGIAKAILAEHSEDEAIACTAFLRSQGWRTGLIDLGTVKSEIGKWKMSGSPAQERARAPTNGNSNGASHFVTKQEQIDINNRKAEEEFNAILNGSKRHGATDVSRPDQSPRGGVPGGHPGRDPRRLLPGVSEDPR